MRRKGAEETGIRPYVSALILSEVFRLFQTHVIHASDKDASTETKNTESTVLCIRDQQCEEVVTVDYISKDEAKKHLIEACTDIADKLYEWEGCSGYSDSVMIIADCLDDLKSADVVEREKCVMKPLGMTHVECSKCGCAIDDIDVDGYDFCPYCGCEIERRTG